jgi:hypothetical protein
MVQGGATPAEKEPVMNPKIPDFSLFSATLSPKVPCFGAADKAVPEALILSYISFPKYL